MTDILDIYDTEVDKIGKVLAHLKDRARTKSLNYEAFGREIKEKFAEIGFTVEISWYEFGFEGQAGSVPGAAMPEITVTGRIDPSHVFDPDRQVHEVTSNVLDIPGAGGVIKTDSGSARRLIEGRKHGHRH